MFFLCASFVFNKELLTKIMIANAILTFGIFFICMYAFEIGYIEIFSLIDIALIYTLTSFIFNISLIKFYKIFQIQEKSQEEN